MNSSKLTMLCTGSASAALAFTLQPLRRLSKARLLSADRGKVFAIRLYSLFDACLWLKAQEKPAQDQESRVKSRESRVSKAS